MYLRDPVGENGDAEPGPLVPLGGLRLDVPQVLADPRESQQAAFVVQQVLDLLRRISPFPQQREDHRRIDVAAAGSHDQPLEGGHAHAGLGRGAELHGAGAGAVAEVAGDQPQLAETAFRGIRRPFRAT